ncbi:50S ribosomal protein L22 [Candidatus Woesearchaeota archaeon]|nr:50S ribosomal protein L22 [Candidatus Woesearchaeota archaeon]
MRYNYAVKQITENSAKAVGRNLSISTRMSVEICNYLRGKKVSQAKNILEQVIQKKHAVPIRRFGDSTAHKPGIGAGKYPIKAAKGILAVIQNAESNAQNKGLSTHHLVISHILAHKASAPWHYGRHTRRKMKRSHIEIVVSEEKEKEKK